MLFRSHEKSTFRSLITAGTEILKDAYEQSAESKLLLNQAEQKIFGILEERSAADATPIDSVLHKVLERMDARMKHEQTLGGVETGFTELDALCGGLHNSELVILAAKRARQLATGGKDPLVNETSDKPTVIALREIEEGLIGPDSFEEQIEDTFGEMLEAQEQQQQADTGF